MLVKEFLPMLRASKATYYNLDREAVLAYKKEYNFLKKHQNRMVSSLAAHRAKEVLQLRHNTSYIRGVTAMKIVAQNIIF